MKVTPIPPEGLRSVPGLDNPRRFYQVLRSPARLAGMPFPEQPSWKAIAGQASSRSCVARVMMDTDPVERAVSGWKTSEGHRAILLSEEFSTTGVGVCGRGRAHYFTQIFVRP